MTCVLQYHSERVYESLFPSERMRMCPNKKEFVITMICIREQLDTICSFIGIDEGNRIIVNLIVEITYYNVARRIDIYSHNSSIRVKLVAQSK